MFFEKGKSNGMEGKGKGRELVNGPWGLWPVGCCHKALAREYHIEINEYFLFIIENDLLKWLLSAISLYNN
jgi:hypothetical protein